MPERPITRTHRFLDPGAFVAFPGGTAWDAPGCREAWFAHRLELDEPPTDLEAAFARWDAHHAGKGVERRYLFWETALDAAPANVPQRCAPVPMLGLVREGACPPGPAPALPLRPVEDLDALIRVAASQHPEYGPAYPGYLRWWVGALVRRGAVVWAAFAEDRPVASVTLVPGPDRWFRFQEIWTDAAWRRRGLCAALVRRATATDPGGTYVIASVEGSDAQRIYERLGFVRVSRAMECSTPVRDAVRGPA